MKNYALTVMIALFAICQSAKAQLPAFTLKSMDGKEVRTDTLANLNGGKPEIVDTPSARSTTSGWKKPV